MSFVRPEEIVKNFELDPGMVVADFGCGSGHYSISAARLVGNSGTVYAIDVQKELLQSVKSQAKIRNLKNIEIILANLEIPGASRLADGSVDFVIISNILFQAENREAVVKEVCRVLKNHGEAAVIEWGKENEKIGPPMEKRIKKEDAQALFFNEGFKLEKEFSAGEHHYGLIFKKS